MVMSGDRLSETKTRMPGMLSLEDLRDLVQRDQVRTVIVGFTDHFGRCLANASTRKYSLKACGTTARMPVTTCWPTISR